jgi:ferrochelatase
MSDSQIGVVLLNLGGPGSLEEVEPFLVNLFSDREIIELPLGSILQPTVARLIARMRGPSVRRNYALIGGGSPQLRITRAQAGALEERLNRNGRRFRVEIAMRYSRPSADDALTALERAGVRRLVTLPLFPHWSQATTGSSWRQFDQTLAAPRWREAGFVTSAVHGYADDAGYLDAFADTIRRALDGFRRSVRHRVVVLFSAHGLPQRLVDRGDPYVEHIEATRHGLLERLRLPNRELLAYQSRTGPVRWIGPGTEEVIRELGHEGVRELLIVPLSFVSDHIETLYEVDILFAEVARRAGIVEYRRPESLNTHPLFINALARLVRAHLAARDN